MATPEEPSARAQLARVAVGAALATDGVVATDAGRLNQRVTPVDGDRVRGVVVTALAGGGYAVSLYLVARMVPLHQLAERVRDGIVDAATRAGLRDDLRTIDVVFEDVVEAEAAP